MFVWYCDFGTHGVGPLITLLIWIIDVHASTYVPVQHWFILVFILGYIDECMVLIININKTINESSFGYQNYGTSRILLFDGYVKVRDRIHELSLGSISFISV